MIYLTLGKHLDKQVGSVYHFVSLPFQLIPEAGRGQSPQPLIKTGFLVIWDY